MLCDAKTLGHGQCGKDALAGRAVCLKHLIVSMEEIRRNSRERIRLLREQIAHEEATLRWTDETQREACRQDERNKPK